VRWGSKRGCLLPMAPQWHQIFKDSKPQQQSEQHCDDQVCFANFDLWFNELSVFNDAQESGCEVERVGVTASVCQDSVRA
jgi:hypothetical protein